jgi:hypothetical protein
MGSSINPLYPTAGNATTAQVRANFLAAKTEIEALQNSTDPNGIKVVENTTVGLGAALGGTSDGRVAYDKDKGVLVRDTDAGTPFWKELAQRRVSKGTTAVRPAFGGITDGNYVNLYYNTDTSTLQLDTGSAWVDVGPGTGGGPTLTEDIASFAFPGDYHQVTHPSVALGDGNIKFSALYTEVGGLTNTNLYFTNTAYEDLNVNGASWVQDAGVTGHFSVSPGTEVTAYCAVRFGFFLCYITSYTAPGTAPGSVTLSTAQATGPITSVENLSFYWGNDVLPTTPDSINYPVMSRLFYARCNSFFGYGGVLKLANLGGVVHQFSGSGYGRFAITLDSTVTYPEWLTYDGSNWVAMNVAGVQLVPATFMSDGLRPLPAGDPSGHFLGNTGGVIPVDDGTPTATGWGELRLLMQAYGAGVSVGFLIGIQTPGDLTTLSGMAVNYTLKDIIVMPSCGSSTGMYAEFNVKRDDETHATFTKYFGFPVVDVHCQVWT